LEYSGEIHKSVYLAEIITFMLEMSEII
jgi:hypothetical protein